MPRMQLLVQMGAAAPIASWRCFPVVAPPMQLWPGTLDCDFWVCRVSCVAARFPIVDVDDSAEDDEDDDERT